MEFDNPYVVPAALCTKCGHQLDRAGGDSSGSPAPGDYTGCLYCGNPMVFTEGLGVRAMTGAEWDALSTEERRALERVQAFADHMARRH